MTRLWVRVPRLPLTRVLGRSAEAPVFQTGQAGSIPAGHILRSGSRVDFRRDGIGTLREFRYATDGNSCEFLYDEETHSGVDAAGTHRLALTQEAVGSIPTSGT